MTGLLSPAAPRATGLGAADIFCFREFVGREVDHVIFRQVWRRVRTQAGNLGRQNDREDKKDCFSGP
jgi:hypothetical protein